MVHLVAAHHSHEWSVGNLSNVAQAVEADNALGGDTVDLVERDAGHRWVLGGESVAGLVELLAQLLLVVVDLVASAEEGTSDLGKTKRLLEGVEAANDVLGDSVSGGLEGRHNSLEQRLWLDGGVLDTVLAVEDHVVDLVVAVGADLGLWVADLVSDSAGGLLLGVESRLADLLSRVEEESEDVGGKSVAGAADVRDDVVASRDTEVSEGGALALQA